MSVRRLMAVLALTTGLVLLGAGAPALGHGDYDGDGDVDLEDFAEFPRCMAGPGGGLGTGCEVFDFDADEDVDLLDLAAFQWYFGTSAPSGMVPVPAGEFEMGDSFDEGDPDELPVHDVYLNTYYIDTNEVTNQQYADWLNWAWAQGGLIEVTDGIVYKAGDDKPYCETYSADSDSRIHWDGATFTITAGKEDHPMLEVSWYGAVAFCNWRSEMEGRTPCYDLETWTCNFEADGYRLPTEAEWEKAAAWDPVQQRHFRFGEHTDGCGPTCLDGQRANYKLSGDPFELGDQPWTTPVGFYNGELHYKEDFGWPGNQTSYQTQNAQSYYGCYDISGNLFEWCHDWYDPSYYTSSPYDNPKGPATGTDRVLRNAYWDSAPIGCRSARRHGNLPILRGECCGFRCAVGSS